jgi:hypothetical protein
VCFASLSISAVLPHGSWAPMLRHAPRLSSGCAITCGVLVYIQAKILAVVFSIRFIFFWVEPHIRQPLVQRHIPILDIRHQVVHSLAILRVRFPIIAVFVGSRALRP